MEKKEEQQLIRAIISEDKIAKQRFYKLYRLRLLGFIKSKVPENVAEEILHDTFLSAFDSLGLFKGESLLYSWLYQIARHEVVDFYRRQKIKTLLFSRLPFLENLASRALGPEALLARRELKNEIKKVFKNLSEGYVRILRLKYIEGRSIKEIAEILGETAKATESRLFRARIAFQNEWSKA